jgi:hypothetical protein
MTVAIDQAWQNSFALGIDHFRALRYRDLAALADFSDTPVLKDNHRIFNCGAAGPIYERAAL